MNNLTKYRTELMGFAMLWIIFFHSQVHIPEFMFPLKFFQTIGYSGVDIFFLLSGMGLTFSISKNESFPEFYKKRIIRIIPTYWICLIFISLKNMWFDQIDIMTFFLSLGGLDFLILGKLETWFIPSILICYAFFPTYYLLSVRHGFRRVFLIFSIIAIFISVLIAGTSLSHLLIFTIRLPIFAFGSYTGLVLVNKWKNEALDNLNINFIVLLMALAVLTVILLKTDNSFKWTTGLWWYPSIFMAFPISILVGSFFGKIQLKYSFATKFLRPFGVYSLEIFLIHGLFVSLGNRLPLHDLSWNFLRLPEYLIYLTCTLALSILLNTFIRKITWILFHNKNPQSTQTSSD